MVNFMSYGFIFYHDKKTKEKAINGGSKWNSPSPLPGPTKRMNEPQGSPWVFTVQLLGGSHLLGSQWAKRLTSDNPRSNQPWK